MANEFMEMGIPEKIEIHREFQHLLIVRKWFGFRFIVLTLFVIVWDAFLLGWYASLLSFSLPSGPGLLFALFPLLHVAAGIGLTYYTLAGYLNRTTIDVEPNALTIRHGPLPWWGNQDVSSRQLKQLYCKRDDHGGNGYRRGYPAYSVHAITEEGRNIKLLSGLDTSEQALFIEQEVEKFLRIEDKPVKGAIR